VSLLDETSTTTKQALFTPKPPATEADLNQTAFRILRIAQWLQHETLSLATMQERLLSDPLAGCTHKPSNDTLWMYLNTLRQLGCSIEAVKHQDLPTAHPKTAREKFFTMTKHPFYLGVAPAEIASLLDLRQEAEQHLALTDMLKLDSFLYSIVKHGEATAPNARNRSGMPPHQAVLARWINYDPYAGCINTIKTAIASQGQHLLWLTYCNNKQHLPNAVARGQRLKHQGCQQSFKAWLMPVRLIYRSGTLYVSGFLAGYKTLSFLRIEQLLEVTAWPLTDGQPKPLLAPPSAKVVAELTSRCDGAQQALVKIWHCSVAQWTHLSQHIGLSNAHGLAQDETVTPFSDEGMAGITITSNSLDFFSLKQRLLALGKPFKIEAPAFFADDVAKELQAMAANYTALHTPA
jgi:hypothetical protein